ncbi:uncharacterized protein BDW70DRAFT_138534 [Aspergillus foveolatus]|uniref:uncharacterized protein n=1 Tax=Aspergillus foveolatus TaxID=210207 RepID=UPI003CCD1594
MAPGSNYSLSFTIEPPTSAAPGVPFSIPVIVAVRSVGNTNSDPLQQLGARAVLWDESGTSSTVDLIGNTSTSVRSRTGNSTSGYAVFNRLTVKSSGRYKLRVMLVLNTASGVSVQGSIDSGIIHVHSGAAASQPPSPAQISRLQALVPENIGISQADIAAWQQV